MLRKLIYIVWMAVGLISCKSKDTANTIITGVAPTFANSKLFISKVSPRKVVVVDSALVDSLGNFTFRLTLKAPDFFRISQGRTGDPITIIASPKEQIDILVAKGAGWNRAIVKGSAGTNQLKLLNDSLIRLEGRLKGIQSQFDTLKYSYKYDSLRRALKSSYGQQFADYGNFLREFVSSNSGSVASIVALYQKKDSLSYFLSEHADIRYFLLVDSVLHRRYPESYAVKAFHSKMESVRSQLKNIKINQESISVGEAAPNFVVKSLMGDTISLSAYRGKYVILSFWASWAKPSVLQNQYLPAVYAKYKPYGFEVIQVSLDRNLEELQNALTPEMRQWKHISEFKMWNSSLVKEYRVGNIPSNFIINRQGVVVAKNVLNQQLFDTLRWFLVRPYLMRRDSLAVK